MFQPSHFQKMAKHLGIDSLSYEKEYNGFMAKLKNFHESKGTPFRRLPWLGGQYLDLYLLYRKVTSAGGWVKVTEEKRWRDIAEVFNLPPTCTNAAFALRQHYSRYLESFERINFFGEDAEDVLSAGRPHTPVGGGAFPTHVPSVAASDYISVISTSKDPTRNFDKLVLSLQCGMPNEVDFAINICMLLSNVSNSVFNLSKAPAVVDTLLAHVGVFSEDSYGLGELYEEWYANQHLERDFIKFWKEGLTVKGVQDILCNGNDDETADQESLFHPARRKIGAKDVECQRIAQVGMIFYNFSFDDTNASVLASHPLCLKFLVLCICSDHGFLQRMSWETLSNLAEKMLMDPIESTTTQMFFQMLHCFLDHKDRYHAINAMDVLGKLCTLEGNDEVIETGLEPEAYQSLIQVLIVSDVQLVLSSLESLYNLSGVGQVTSDHIAEVHHSIDILVCLVTMDAESFGPEALSEVQILEKRIPSAISATSKPQSASAPVVQQQPKEPVQPHQVPPSSPSPAPVPSPSPNPAPIKTTGSEIDPETFTYNWLQATYEPSPGSAVSRIDIYADYLSSCSRLARVGILNATAFNRIIKLAFPDGQLRRVQSGVNVQYVLAGLKRKSNPLPVKSRTDSSVSQQPSTVSSHPSAQQAVQRMSPGQQSNGRTPTPPVQTQGPPAWNPAKQQNIVVSKQTHTPAMPRQVSSGNQQQMPGMGRMPRRASVTSQGAIQTTPDQGARQFPAAAVKQQDLQAPVDHRQMISGQMQKNISPTDKGQSLERLAAIRRANVEGISALQRQNVQGFKHHQNQGQALQRVPLSPQSAGPQRVEHPQQTGQRMPPMVPASPGQRGAPGTPQPAPVCLPGNVRSPQSSLTRTPLPPPRPIQPNMPRPAQTTPPTGPMQRPLSPAEPSSYRPTAAYRQPTPPYPQQQNVRPLPPAYSGRHTSLTSYPPLAPKPAPGMNVQFSQDSQARKQVPSNTAIAGSYPGAQQVPRSPLHRGEATRQTFQPHVPIPNTPSSPLLAPSMGSRQPFASSQPDVPGNIRPGLGQDSRQVNREPLPGSRPEGVVLIAQEERAADVVSTGLIDGAEEQKIVVVENKHRTETITKGDVTYNSTSTQRPRLAHDIATNQQMSVSEGKSLAGRTLVDSRGELCSSNIGEHSEQPMAGLSINEAERNLIVPNTMLHPSSNGTLKRDLNEQITHGSNMSASSDGNHNGQRDSISEGCVPAKRARMSSLENELDNSSSIPSRTGSPTPLVNGDIKGDTRNKLMDKLLDKDLHLPLNGVCGIDTSELDLLASDGERLSSSKASSPDLFGSETNSDFGKYLEESDTDTGLFSDVLQGDLRIDPMENGTEGTHPMPSSMPVFPGGSYSEGGNTSNEKGISTGVAEQQGKIPIPPASRPDPIPDQYSAMASRQPVAVNTAWNSTHNVSQVSKAGLGQSFGPEVQQKVAFYPQQGHLQPTVGNRSQMHNVSMENKRRVDPQASSVLIQKPAIPPHQNIQSGPPQMIPAHDSSSAIQPTAVPKNILPRPPGPDFVNSMSPGSQGAGIPQSLPVSSPFLGGQQMPTVDTSLQRASGWTPSGVQQQHLARTQPAPQKIAPAGFQAGVRHNLPPGSQAVPPGSQNVSLPSGWQQPQLQQPQQKSLNAYRDVRTQSVATPGSTMYEPSAPQIRQAPVTTQYPHPALTPAGKNVVQSPAVSMPVNSSTLPAQGSHLVESGVPQLASVKPYRCRWTTCHSSFDTSKGLFAHVVNEHVPRDSLVMSCMWEGCAPVRRSRSSLLFHLQQKHSEPSPVASPLPPQQAQHQSPPVQPPPPPAPPSPAQPPPPPTPSAQSTSFVPAYHFLARMLQSLQGEEESPLTKSVRLTAALVLRNLAQYSALARSLLRRHEGHLSLVAMSNSEAANAVAACLSELSPHRKPSSDDSDTLIWALNR